MLIVGSNCFSQTIPEKMSKPQYERCACYFNFDHIEFAISIVYNVIEKNIYSKEMFVIKSRTNEYNWKLSSDVLFESDIYGSSGDRICINQAWSDNKFNSKRIINSKVNYGGDAQVMLIDSTYAIFTTKLYAKENHNNIPGYYEYPMLFLLKYNNVEKYWKKIELKTFSYRPHETLVIRKINDSKYCVYNTIESCYVIVENSEIKIINN